MQTTQPRKAILEKIAALNPAALIRLAKNPNLLRTLRTNLGWNEVRKFNPRYAAKISNRLSQFARELPPNDPRRLKTISRIKQLRGEPFIPNWMKMTPEQQQKTWSFFANKKPSSWAEEKLKYNMNGLRSLLDGTVHFNPRTETFRPYMPSPEQAKLNLKRLFKARFYNEKGPWNDVLEFGEW